MRIERTLATGETVEALEDLGEKMYSEEEFRKLLLSTDCSRYHYQRNENYIIVGLGGWCTVRTNELLGIHPEDIDLKKRDLRIFTLKQRLDLKGKIRHVPIHESLIFRLETYLDGKPKGEQIFEINDSAIRVRMRTLCRCAGVKYKGYKGLRHRFGSHFAPFFQPHELAKLMGHSSISTIMIYYHQRIEDIKERYEEASSGNPFNLKKGLGRSLNR